MSVSSCYTAVVGVILGSVMPLTLRAAPVDEVIVSASRIELPREQVGSSVSVLEGAEIDRRAPSLVADLLREIASAAVNRGGPMGSVTACDGSRSGRNVAGSAAGRAQKSLGSSW